MPSTTDWMTAIATTVLAVMATFTLISMYILFPRSSQKKDEIPSPHSLQHDEILKLLKRVKGLEDRNQARDVTMGEILKRVEDLEDQNKVHAKSIVGTGKILEMTTETDET